eukprot:gene3122-biopygen1493
MGFELGVLEVFSDGLEDGKAVRLYVGTDVGLTDGVSVYVAAVISTANHLDCPLHGSPNTDVEAAIVHLSLPTQLPLMIDTEFIALQSLLILKDPQPPVAVPKEAKITLSKKYPLGAMSVRDLNSTVRTHNLETVVGAVVGFTVGSYDLCAVVEGFLDVDGRLDGTRLGVIDGWRDADFVGSSDGRKEGCMEEGLAEGILDGLLVGVEDVGLDVGIADGFALGLPDGRVVGTAGFIVGDFVGVRLGMRGFEVGLYVGVLVGVGLDEGRLVGTTVGLRKNVCDSYDISTDNRFCWARHGSPKMLREASTVQLRLPTHAALILLTDTAELHPLGLYNVDE